MDKVRRWMCQLGVVMVIMGAAVLPRLSRAAVYKVGDSAGWTIIANVDYKQWAATKTFQLGDVIVFEYNAQSHNVMRVTHAMYRSCNASAPLDKYTTGNDTITITSRRHHFFLCGVPGHCQAGQKVDINALDTPSPSTAPTPSSPFATPSVDSTQTAPSHSPSKAAPTYNKDHRLFSLLGLVMAIFAVFVPQIL